MSYPDMAGAYQFLDPPRTRAPMRPARPKVVNVCPFILSCSLFDPAQDVVDVRGSETLTDAHTQDRSSGRARGHADDLELA